MTDWPREVLIDLRETLANLYPTVDDSRVVVGDAGLRAGRIRFDELAYNNWHAILENAVHSCKVEAVIEMALKDFPDNDRLKRALERRPPPPSAAPEPADWKGPDAKRSLEKIMGDQSTLVPISYLQIGLAKSRSVVRIIRADGGSGSGFVTDGNILVTNNHVLANAEAAKDAVIQFNYQKMPDGTNAPYDEFRLAPDTLFHTDKGDDWTAVQIEGDPAATWGALSLERTRIRKGAPVNIIQHPGGGPKQISLTANVVVYVDDARVQYLTDTLPGSSGSPVFDAKWNVVALHHSGGWIAEPNAKSKTTFYRNEGIAIGKVIDGLAALG